MLSADYGAKTMNLTLEVRIAVPVFVASTIESGVALPFTVIRVVDEHTILLPQNSIHFLGAVIYIDILQQTFAHHTHAA